MACSSSSNGRNVSSADGFRRTTKTMKNFWKRIGSYWEDAVANNTLPDQSEEEEWSVWLVKPNQMFKHHSLLIESTDKGGSFTIELLVNVETKEVVPESRPLDRNDPRYSDLLTFNHLGNITTSAESLFRKAMDCLENFGPYDEITNNCQGYCQSLAKAYGLKTGLTDAGKVAVGAAVVGVGAVAVVLGAVGAVFAAGIYLFGGSGKKEK